MRTTSQARSKTNNLGTDHRDITDIALKLDYNIESGTFTSISDYNFTKEIDTGDAYDFRPIKDSIAYNYFFAAITGCRWRARR